ncbi:MAG: glycosyltransferase family 4 protein [Rhodobacteraceae bacterium]|nr:glycosyltransferase family 4 protein [Paracoccaceae bacterium]
MSDPASLRVAYLTGEYPKASHTFIQREIASLRALGATVLACSIRRTGDRYLIGPEERDEAARTFHVLERAKQPSALLMAHGKAFLRAPGRYLSAVRLAARTGRPGLKGTLRQAVYFLEAGVLADHLRAQRVTHLHNHFADSSANVAMLTSALSGIPFSYTLHGPAELFEPESWHLGTKVARAAFTVCISHFARSQAMLFSDPSDWSRLRIVHCGVVPARYDTPVRPVSGRARLLFVGRLTAIKGVRVLIDALERARAVNPAIDLTLIGDGEDRPWVEAQAARLGGISCLGFQSQSEVAAALADHDAFVLPSFAEGVPVVLMEAMASRRPVIATRVGGVAELVADGRSGLLVAPGDAQALAQAILQLVDDADLRARMGAAGRSAVTADFDVEIEARRILALFLGQAGADLRPDPWKAP